jgi:segregation and condensation protein A
VDDYKVKLPEFEGPFALLFHLIEKAEVDIYEIRVAEITAQYLGFLQQMQELNLDIASEFLVMAATLLKLKSKKLLPGTIEIVSETDESIYSIDSQEELVQRLIEYRHFRSIAQELRQCEQAQRRVFIRSLSGEKVLLVNPEDEISAAGVTLPGLLQAFQRLLAEHERQPQEVIADEIPVQEKMKQVLRLLRKKEEGLDFLELFQGKTSLPEIIATFFALLELMRLRKIRIWQSGPLGSLVIMRRA